MDWFDMICPSRLEIDLTQLDANLSAVRRLVGPGVAVCGVGKADAYGLGIQPIAGRLRRCGINMLAVYSLEQAEALVEHVTDVAVLVLMPICQFKRDGSLVDDFLLGGSDRVLHVSNAPSPAAPCRTGAYCLTCAS